MRSLTHLPTRLALTALLLAPTLAGCYHARIETGARPGPTVIDKPWALSFVYGLVPPPVVSTAQECPKGAAVVETQQSFVNGLVSALSAGLVTPMRITVTCAAEGSASAGTVAVDDAASVADAQAAFAEAADLAVETGAPVVVRFED